MEAPIQQTFAVFKDNTKPFMREVKSHLADFYNIISELFGINFLMNFPSLDT